MNGILKMILDSGMVQTQVTKAIRWGATAVSGAAVAMLVKFLTTHGFVISPDMMTDINNFGTGIAGIIIAGGTLLWGLRDAKRVDVALKASAQAGVVVPPSAVAGIKVGDQIAVNGQLVTIGKTSPADKPEVTAALNNASAGKGA